MGEDLHDQGVGDPRNRSDHSEDGIEEVERIDLSALDPTADPARFEPLVRSIAARAAGELARRSRERLEVTEPPFDQPAIELFKVMRDWQRVLWPVAAAVTLVSLATLQLVDHRSAASGSADSQLAEALGVPAYMASWFSGDEIPGPAELVFSQEEQ